MKPPIAGEIEMIRWNTEGVILDDFFYRTEFAAEILELDARRLTNTAKATGVERYKIRGERGQFYKGIDLANFYTPIPLDGKSDTVGNG